MDNRRGRGRGNMNNNRRGGGRANNADNRRGRANIDNRRGKTADFSDRFKVEKQIHTCGDARSFFSRHNTIMVLHILALIPMLAIGTYGNFFELQL